MDWQPLALFFISLLTGTFSGMAGGGGGFITLPVLVALGLSPQQAVATNKLAGFGLNAGSVMAFKRKSFENPRLLAFFMFLAVGVSFAVPHVFKAISGHDFQLILGALLVMMVPVALSEKQGLEQQRVSGLKKIIGAALVVIALFMQGVFSAGAGAVNTVLLIYFFGLTALQANAMRRVITLSLNIFIVAVLAATSTFIVYRLALAGMAGGLIGGYAGSKIALRKGERFTKYALAVFMLASGLWLLATAS